MKICKVKLIKKLNGSVCNNIYPVGYNPNKVNVIAYDEELLTEGDNTGYCIGLVSDNFNFTDDMVEIIQTEAEDFIDDRSNKIFDEDLKTKFAAARKQMITDAGI